jgi:putative component of membrane protein insertase Oxa1/YidC/SpoIIIJ protein YidD
MQAQQPRILHQSLKPISRVADITDRLGLMGVANRVTLVAVQVSQKHLSPHKGFACAHRRLYDQESCSQYFRQMVATHGLVNAIPLFQERLQDCHQANLTLRRQSLVVTTEDDDQMNDNQTNEDQGKNKPGRKSKNDSYRDSGCWNSYSFGDCSG